jgi:hypothetical protein
MSVLIQLEKLALQEKQIKDKKTILKVLASKYPDAEMIAMGSEIIWVSDKIPDTDKFQIFKVDVNTRPAFVKKKYVSLSNGKIKVFSKTSWTLDTENVLNLLNKSI